MSNTLLVPITLDVLLANNDLLGRDSFRRWEYQYRNLNSDYFQSPEPMGFDQDIQDDKPATGAFLHWTLPRALRSSRPGSSSEYPLVPNRWLVVRLCRTPADPGGNPKAWVVESDCPATGKARASSFMVAEQVKASWAQSADPNRRQATPIPVTRLDLANLGADPATAAPADGTGAYIQAIGQAFDLGAPWQERADAPLFLTAVAPGNLEFSAYVPFNANVFSFYDDLDGVPDTATLSYQVIGWYSDPAQDIVATGPASGISNSAAVLLALNWTLAVPPDDLKSLNLGTSLYAGLAWGLSWQKDAVAPAPDQLMAVEATANMTVAVGNTSVDAFTALVGGQLALQGNAQNTIELLRAFHYDMLPLLNQVNGDALLAARIRQEWFSGRAGGTRWTIAPDRVPAGAAPDSTGAAPTAAESAWLLQLNHDQQALDEALTELTRLQWDLSAAWWKTGYQSAATQREMSMNGTGTDYLEQAAALDATKPTSILTRVLAQLATVDGLLPRVPQPVPGPDGNAQQAFLQGVAQFVAGKGLGPGKVLKAVAQPRFWLPNNPSVLISGVEPSAIGDADGSLPVRLLGPQQISTLTVEGTAVAGLGAAVPPLANLAAVPAGVAGLYQELFLLDPANAPLIAAHAGLDAAKVAAAMQARDTAAYASCQLPALLPAAWAQQWNPLYLEWEVTYTDVPYEQVDATTGAHTKNWHFNGTDYDLAPGLGSPNSFTTQTVSGRSVLSAHTRFTFEARLKGFVDQYGTAEADLQGLYDGIEKVDDWRFLGQELVHFNEWLTQRDARAFRKPTVETFQYNGSTVAFEKVMGYADPTRQLPYDTPPQSQGLVGSVPAVGIGGPSDFPFHGIRSGQAYFSYLVLYDKFGRQRKLIMPSDNGLFDADSFPLVRDAALVEGSQLTTAKCAFQLPPRLLQPARLDLLLVDCQAAALPPNPAPDASPIGGWLIVNHLDQALLLFDPTGKSMGELRVTKLAAAAAQVRWAAPPHGSLATVAEIAQRAPQLGAFVAAAQGRDEADFLALLGAIDSTLWTTDPLGNRADQNLSVLVGRPLALVRVQAQFALAGSPLASCDWPALLASAPDDGVPAFTTSAFSIRFGDLASRQDGVIGYFEGDDYAHFNSVAPPSPLPAQQYVREIGQPLPDGTDNYLMLPFDGQTSQLLTLLVDPRADIHATTGILPVKTLTIPAPLVHQALANIELPFRVGPLLTRKTPAAPGHAQAVSYPSISEKHGTWSWWEAEVPRADAAPGTPPWQEYELTSATTTAAFSPGPATLRDGYLQFRTSLDSG
jgi:hypothetical protein